MYFVGIIFSPLGNIYYDYYTIMLPKIQYTGVSYRHYLFITLFEMRCCILSSLNLESHIPLIDLEFFE